VFSDGQRAMHILLATTHMQHGRNESNVFLDHILVVKSLDALILPSAEKTEC
jgi:hypothetical protein